MGKYGEDQIVWSLFQLMSTNQLKVIPVGRLPRVNIEVEGLWNYAYFEVIELLMKVIDTHHSSVLTSALKIIPSSSSRRGFCQFSTHRWD